MGTNRRYAESIDRAGEEKHLARLAQKLPLQTLDPRELDLERQPLTKDPHPSKVWAWVHFGSRAGRVRGEAVMWTEHAVAVRFTLAGTEYRTWVWANAVTPLRELASGEPTRNAAP